MKLKAKKQTRKMVLLIVLALVVIGVVGAIWLNKRDSAPQSSIPTGGHGKDTAVHAGPSHDISPSPTASAAISNPSHPTTSLAKPVETLNEHTVSLSSASTLMDSTCSSVAGVTCYIQASNSAGRVLAVSDTKNITSATGDGVELIWDAKKLAVGDWNIQAVAAEGGQKSLSDVQTLKVSQ